VASQRGNHATASRRVASRRAKVSDDDGREAREMLPPNLLGSENEVSSSIQNFRCENEPFEQARTHARTHATQLLRLLLLARRIREVGDCRIALHCVAL
jgi:hypothetical protein